MSTASEEGASASPPEEPSVSRGSSVSSSLRDEYEDLLRYAVVTPIVDTRRPSKGGPSLKKTEGGGRPSKPLTNAPKRPIQTEISRVEFDEELSVSGSESDHRPPPDLQHSETVPASVASAGRSHEPSPGSGDPMPESHDEEVQQPLMVDPEMARLENQMDIWCLDLKRNVMAEFDQARIRLAERHRSELHQERQQHAFDMRQLQEELERYKELLATYEQSVGRKDHVIANLTRGLQKQKEKVELQKSFSSWKLRHSDEKRESFTGVLASRHHQHKIKARVWGAWFGIIQHRWKNRVEKACQSKAEEVCVQLTEEYEERLAAVHRSLDESNHEVSGLKAERALYEENMKKAFMRGVCALNLEAMSMFRYHEPSSENGENHDPPTVPTTSTAATATGTMPQVANDPGTIIIPPQGTVPLVIKPPNGGLGHSATDHASQPIVSVPQQRIHLTTSAPPLDSPSHGEASLLPQRQRRGTEERGRVKKQSSAAGQVLRTAIHKKRETPSVTVQRHQVN